MRAPTASYSEAVDISSADHEFALHVRRIYVGGSGAMVCRLRGDAADQTFQVVAGTTLDLGLAKVVKAGTTATGLVGLGFDCTD